MTITKVVGYVVSFIFFLLAAFYALASSYAPIRLAISAFLFIAGFGILIFVRKQQPTKIIQKIEMPGDIEAQAVRCPNCTALLDVDKIKITDGVPSIRCSYCGHVFKVREEPKW